jgi:hypothetical protein
MKPRPGRHDKAVIDIAFEKIWPEIRKWVGHTEDDEDTKNAAKKVLSSAYGNDDGYQLARDFEHATFMPDSDLVEILDGWGSHLYRAHEEVLKTWAKENPIEPRFKVGDIVTFDAGYRFASKMLNDGEIIKVDLETMVYTINSPSAGHIKPGTNKSGVTGCFADFEVLHAMNPPKEVANAT